GLSGRTLISRVIGPHPAPACWGVSVACQEPAAGALISVNQKYGGPPRRSPGGAAPPPSGPGHEGSSSRGLFGPSKTHPEGTLPAPPGAGAGARPRPPRRGGAPILAPARSPPREPEGMRR